MNLLINTSLPLQNKQPVNTVQPTKPRFGTLAPQAGSFADLVSQARAAQSKGLLPQMDQLLSRASALPDGSPEEKGLNLVNVGKLYLNGIGMDTPADHKDPVKAAHYFAEAEKIAGASALLEMGKIYARGCDALNSTGDKAESLLLKAALIGNSSIKIEVGKLFAVPFTAPNALKPNLTTVEHCFTQAAQTGDLGEQMALAKMYAEGYGLMQPDVDKALRFYQKAADLSFQHAYPVAAIQIVEQLTKPHGAFQPTTESVQKAQGIVSRLIDSANPDNRYWAFLATRFAAILANGHGHMAAAPEQLARFTLKGIRPV